MGAFSLVRSLLLLLGGEGRGGEEELESRFLVAKGGRGGGREGSCLKKGKGETEVSALSTFPPPLES